MKTPLIYSFYFKNFYKKIHNKMNQLKNLQRAQVLISCGILTGVWTNLYVNVQSKCPHLNKCPFNTDKNKPNINN